MRTRLEYPQSFIDRVVETYGEDSPISECARLGLVVLGHYLMDESKLWSHYEILDTPYDQLREKCLRSYKAGNLYRDWMDIEAKHYDSEQGPRSCIHHRL